MSIKYTAPPTCAAFMKSDSFGRLIAGPVGSGKTTSCIMELFRRVAAQKPAADGFRYSRWAIVRQTLRQLEETVLRDIMAWFADAGDAVTYKVSDRTVYVQLGDIRSEWPLIPLDDPADQKRLLSLQLTGCWMSEAIEMNVNLVAAIAGRCGRYPSGPRGVPSFFGIIADTNFPTEGSLWHEFMEAPPSEWEVYKQPSGLSENAENLEFLTQTEETLKLPADHPARRAAGRKYYERLSTNKNKDWVKRYVEASYGNDPSGSAVFKNSYSRRYHRTSGLEPVPGMLIVVGQDFGRSPWSVITQLDHKGRLLVLEEVMAEDTGLDQHIRMALRPALYSGRYSNRPIVVIGDPAGRARSSLFETNEYQLLEKAGFMAVPAVTNEIEKRLLAVEGFMLNVRMGEPQFLIDEDRCPTLVRALEGGYRYKRRKSGINEPTPEKNEYSHGMDSLQYAALCCAGEQYKSLLGRIMYRGARNESRKENKFSSKAWT